ncbi:MAG: phosphoribosylformylglycinamidine cyclo-ligase [Deltaproteobacteria bacterium]|nr:phosphoribosylformylglycinamidine cyclo-ligase [Deltaproteobacteria bacterium]
MKPITYKDAGVDIDAGDALVERIKPLAARTRIPEVLADVGGFAGMCRVPSGIDEPILVSGTDGVGTKLKLAFELDSHDGIGQDLVGMCVNDILTCGARPLFFLDYFATGKLALDTATRVVAGIARACEASGCALLGGETAEMPGMYGPGEYDLAGFAVGVVARSKIIDGKRTQPGDVVIGLGSSGLHSNGYSLARRVVEARSAKLTEHVAELGCTLGEALMAPTRLYGKPVRALLDASPAIDVKAMSHITGGGLPGNLPRVIPEGLGLRIDLGAFARPKVFEVLASLGPIDEHELRRTFNVGLGYVVVVAKSDEGRALSALASVGEEPRVIGEIIAVDPATEFEARVQFVGAPPR